MHWMTQSNKANKIKIDLYLALTVWQQRANRCNDFAIVSHKIFVLIIGLKLLCRYKWLANYTLIYVDMYEIALFTQNEDLLAFARSTTSTQKSIKYEYRIFVICIWNVFSTSFSSTQFGSFRFLFVFQMTVEI